MRGRYTLILKRLLNFHNTILPYDIATTRLYCHTERICTGSTDRRVGTAHQPLNASSRSNGQITNAIEILKVYSNADH